jgi:quinolinate synthase
VIAPVEVFLLIEVKPPSDLTGPEKVELAMYISLSWQMSKLILRQGNFIIHKKNEDSKHCPRFMQNAKLFMHPELQIHISSLRHQSCIFL